MRVRGRSFFSRVLVIARVMSESDIEKLTQLLLQQAELSARREEQSARREEQSAQREERLAQLVEQLAAGCQPLAAASGESGVPASQTTSSETPSSETPSSDTVAAAAPRSLPASATPAPHLSSSASLRDFTVWREKLDGYLLLTGASALPIASQRAVLLSLVDEDWHRVLRYGLNVSAGSDISVVVDAMEAHLRKQRSVLVDRRAFYARVQEEGESFEDFLCAVKELAAFCDFCTQCFDSRLRDKVVCGLSDEDTVKRLLEDPDLNLQKTVDICRASENARMTCADIRAPTASVSRMSAYRRARSGSRGARPEDQPSGRPAAPPGARCRRCGRGAHADPAACRAASATCNSCGRRGHYAVVCEQGARGSTASAAPGPSIRRVIQDVYVNGISTRPTPKVDVLLSTPGGVFTVAARADSGAEATVIGEDALAAIGVDSSQLETGLSETFAAVGRYPLTCLGSFKSTLQLGSRSTDATVFVIRELTGLLLSWFDCVALEILPRDFPAQIRRIDDASLPADDVMPSVTQPDDVTPSVPPAGRRLPLPAGDVMPSVTRPGDVTPSVPPAGRRLPLPADDVMPSVTQPDDVTPSEPPAGRRPPAHAEQRDGARPAAGAFDRLPVWDSDTDPPEEVRAAHAAALVDCFPRVFGQDSTLRVMDGGPMVIELRPDATPTSVTAARPIPFAWRAEVKAQLDDLLHRGIIVPVSYPTEWCHPISCVPKNPTGFRLCVDLTGLNQYVKRPTYPCRPPHDAVTSLPSGNRWMSTLDAKMGYFQVPLADESQDLTCFITPWGRFKFVRCPMGCNASGDEYNRRGDAALGDIPNCVKIVDDILAVAPTYRQHLQQVIEILQRCDDRGITLNSQKFQFARNEVKFCGYKITPAGYTSDNEKARAIADFPRPENITDLRSFMGLVNQLGGLTPELATTTQAFRDLLKSRHIWCWTEQHEAAFLRTKSILSSPPVMAFFDPGLPTVLQTDAAKTRGLGFALLQRHGDDWKLVQCGSRFLTDVESRYAVVELELAAVLWACKKCHVYLAGMPHFDVVVDHRPLVAILNHKQLNAIDNPRLQRMREKLSAYSFTTSWQKGSAHVIPDALSRAPSSDPVAEDDVGEDDDTLHASVIAALQAANQSEDGAQLTPLMDPTLERIRAAAERDSAYRSLRDLILAGFPENRYEAPLAVRPYWGGVISWPSMTIWWSTALGWSSRPISAAVCWRDCTTHTRAWRGPSAVPGSVCTGPASTRTWLTPSPPAPSVVSVSLATPGSRCGKRKTNRLESSSQSQPTTSTLEDTRT